MCTYSLNMKKKLLAKVNVSNKSGGGRKGGGGVRTLEVESFRELALTGLLPTLPDGGGGMICIVTEN